MTPEIYMPDWQYQFLVKHLVKELRKRGAYNARYSGAHQTLRSASWGAIDTGVSRWEDHRLMGDHYGELIDALIALPGDLLTDRIEADCVKFTLGEIGNIWPESIRPTDALAAA